MATYFLGAGGQSPHSVSCYKIANGERERKPVHLPSVCHIFGASKERDWLSFLWPLKPQVFVCFYLCLLLHLKPTQADSTSKTLWVCSLKSERVMKVKTRRRENPLEFLLFSRVWIMMMMAMETVESLDLLLIFLYLSSTEREVIIGAECDSLDDHPSILMIGHSGLFTGGQFGGGRLWPPWLAIRKPDGLKISAIISSLGACMPLLFALWWMDDWRLNAIRPDCVRRDPEYWRFDQLKNLWKIFPLKHWIKKFNQKTFEKLKIFFRKFPKIFEETVEKASRFLKNFWDFSQFF